MNGNLSSNQFQPVQPAGFKTNMQAPTLLRPMQLSQSPISHSAMGMHPPHEQPEGGPLPAMGATLGSIRSAGVWRRPTRPMSLGQGTFGSVFNPFF